MKKIKNIRNIFLIILISLFSLNYSFASIEDNSIIDELNKGEVKELNVDFKLKSFESCQDLESVMGKYIKDYWKSNKDRYSHPIMFK
jgi:hypothetical protein